MIKYSEFIAATIDQGKYLTRQNLQSLFKYFDQGSKGYLTKADLTEILQRNGVSKSESELTLMLREITPVAEAKISFEEFQAIMKDDVATITPLSD